MTRDRIESYLRELMALVKQAREAEAAIDNFTAQAEIARAMNDTKAAEQILGRRAEARTFFEQVGALACKKANRKDLEGCERLIRQLSARLQEHANYEDDVAIVEARFEMAAEMGEFEGEQGLADRAGLEKLLETKRQRVTAQLQKASDLVPDKPVVLTL